MLRKPCSRSCTGTASRSAPAEFARLDRDSAARGGPQVEIRPAIVPTLVTPARRSSRTGITTGSRGRWAAMLGVAAELVVPSGLVTSIEQRACRRARPRRRRALARLAHRAHPELRSRRSGRPRRRTGQRVARAAQHHAHAAAGRRRACAAQGGPGGSSSGWPQRVQKRMGRGPPAGPAGVHDRSIWTRAVTPSDQNTEAHMRRPGCAANAQVRARTLCGSCPLRAGAAQCAGLTRTSIAFAATSDERD